ncbi:DUF3397 domain-containing protein [Lactococcus ileimucosae]|uniref:DUF3397 domain-containing protein n=1 Tax=Lactococcus ileimucosae TaxID=2941329 RepID=UPI0020431382|nr:DUF3397 domain-containing protein [Lactococcus ileimucosae]
MLPKIIATLYPLLTWLVLVFAFKFLRIRQLTRRKLLIADVYVLFLIYGLQLFSEQLTAVNILPYYLLILSILALILLLLDLFYYKAFNYKRFFKLFWRLTFIITLALYIAMIVMIYLH